MRVVLIRHGHTLGNESKAHYLSLTDQTMLLTPTGEADVRRLRSVLSEGGVSIGASLSAPEERCKQTARILGFDGAVVDGRLRAQSWGTFNFDGAVELLESLERWPAGLDARFPGGESAREVQDRIVPLARELAKSGGGETIGIVTHGVVINLLLGHWFDWPPNKVEQARSIPPGTALLLDFDSATPRVTQMGAV